MKILVLAVLLITLPACGSYNKDDQQLLADAAGYLEQGNVNAAVIELKNILQRHADNAEARYLLAGIYLDYHDFSSAEKEYSHAILSGWDKAEACHGLAIAMQGQGRYQDLLEDCSVSEDFPAAIQADLLALRATAMAENGEQYNATQYLQRAERLQPNSPLVLQARIELLLRDDKPQEADRVLAQALTLHPDYTTFKLQQAERLNQQDDTNTAKDLLTAIINADPDGYITGNGQLARTALARLLISQQDYQTAKSLISPLAKSDPEVLYLKGLIAYRQGNFDLASQLTFKLLNRLPGYQPAILLHGASKYAQNEFEQASFYLSKYVAAEPDNYGARNLLSQAYMKLGQFDEARNNLLHDDASSDPATTNQLDNNNLDSSANSANILDQDKSTLVLVAEAALLSGNLDEAITLSKQLQQRLPKSAVGYEIEGNAQMGKEDFQSASVAFETAQKLQSTFVLAIKLSDALRYAGQGTESTKPLRDWLKQNPDEIAVHHALAAAWIELGVNDKAIKTYVQILDTEPESLVALNNLAWLYQLENNPMALEMARRAHQVDDNDADVLDTYGWLLVQHGDTEQGRMLLSRALEQLPNVPEVQYHYAVALLRTGETNEAVKRLQRLLADDVEFIERNEAQQLLDSHTS